MSAEDDLLCPSDCEEEEEDSPPWKLRRLSSPAASSEETAPAVSGDAVGTGAGHFPPPKWEAVTVDGKRRRKCAFVHEGGHPCLTTTGDTKRKIEEHWRIHTKEKPHACTFEGCTKTFAQSNALVYHMRTHTGSRPYQCTHEGCTKTFSQSGHLTKHVRTHTGSRPYQCTHEGCTKTFAQSGHLTNHMRTHKGEVSNPCKGDKTSGTCGIGLSGGSKYDYHCVHCFCKNWPNSVRAKNAKKYLHAKEQTVRAFLEVTFSEYKWSFDRRHAVGVLVRPDAKAVLGKRRLLIVEVDEDSHDTYTCALEREREAIIAKHAPRKTVIHLIRFNPDAYNDPVTDKRVPSCFRFNKESGTTIVDPKRKADWDARLAMLKGVIDEIVAHQHEDIAVPKCLLAEDRYKHVIPIELFYDNVLEKWPNGNVQKLAALKRNAKLRKASHA